MKDYQKPSKPVHEQIVAACRPEQMDLLMHYDHYAVKVGGRFGVLLTNEWMAHYEWESTTMLQVVFGACAAYPLAPAAVQTVIDDLTM